RGAHLFCLPSRYPERRGIAALEALAAGAVVLAPPQGIFPYLATSTGGVHLTPAEPAPLARALAELAGDPGRLAAMSRAGAQALRHNFTTTRMTQAALTALDLLPKPPPT
ncbi:MAG TPA: glycosyltransferase, partial [Candidatus Brocadiia bacterium]|nr:glycosyltransferase [Candidatus Brocadiia bacterium]